jgi:glycerol-3-phosphate cytidylyltransferase
MSGSRTRRVAADRVTRAGVAAGRTHDGEGVQMADQTVITFGTFDVLHVGHVRVLNRAAAFGDRLVVGVSSDVLNFSKKGRNPVFSQDERVELVSNLKVVDEVFVEESLELKRDYITKFRADVLVMGDDWAGKFDWVSDVCKVVYLPRTPSVSTTAIIEHIVTTRPAAGA